MEAQGDFRHCALRPAYPHNLQKSLSPRTKYRPGKKNKMLTMLLLMMSFTILHFRQSNGEEKFHNYQET